uniref:Uncharacterized protein n=1 Tax=viral metagenome TaxID=1070528 RepID=A0A6C0LBS6_9ZZZZ
MSGNSLSGNDKNFLIDLIDKLLKKKSEIITDDMQGIISATNEYYKDDLAKRTSPNDKITNLKVLITSFTFGLLILEEAIGELNSIKIYMENDNDKNKYNNKTIINIEKQYVEEYKPFITAFISEDILQENLDDDEHLDALNEFVSSNYTKNDNIPGLVINIEMILYVIVNLLIILPILAKKTSDVANSSGQAGGFRKKNNLKPSVPQSKEILGKIRRIYKVAGSRKEHIKYKGELISVSDYKKLVSQAKALKSQNKPVTKPKAKPTAKSATKPKAKSATKPKAKSATKPKAK